MGGQYRRKCDSVLQLRLTCPPINQVGSEVRIPTGERWVLWQVFVTPLNRSSPNCVKSFPKGERIKILSELELYGT
jgi:hypothetical protein